MSIRAWRSTYRRVVTLGPSPLCFVKYVNNHSGRTLCVVGRSHVVCRLGSISPNFPSRCSDSTPTNGLVRPSFISASHLMSLMLFLPSTFSLDYCRQQQPEVLGNDSIRLFAVWVTTGRFELNDERVVEDRATNGKASFANTLLDSISIDSSC
jgi:hypothetical protein